MNLQLPLKTKWFEMTKAGIKTEDYRGLNDYWIKRLCVKNPNIVIEEGDFYGQHYSLKSFKTNTMTLGYPKKGDPDRIIQFEHAGIEIREGNPEWGAEPGKLYFVIKHGKKYEK